MNPISCTSCKKTLSLAFSGDHQTDYELRKTNDKRLPHILVTFENVGDMKGLPRFVACCSSVCMYAPDTVAAILKGLKTMDLSTTVYHKKRLSASKEDNLALEAEGIEIAEMLALFDLEIVRRSDVMPMDIDSESDSEAEAAP